MAIDLTSCKEEHTHIKVGDTVKFLPGYSCCEEEVVVEVVYPNPYNEKIWMVDFMHRGRMRAAPLAACVLVEPNKGANPYLWK